MRFIACEVVIYPWLAVAAFFVFNIWVFVYTLVSSFIMGVLSDTWVEKLELSLSFGLVTAVNNIKS